jgi:hypothetical protein
MFLHMNNPKQVPVKDLLENFVNSLGNIAGLRTTLQKSTYFTEHEDEAFETLHKIESNLTYLDYSKLDKQALDVNTQLVEKDQRIEHLEQQMQSMQQNMKKQMDEMAKAMYQAGITVYEKKALHLNQLSNRFRLKGKSVLNLFAICLVFFEMILYL